MLDRKTIDRLWEKGFRPIEIYVFNDKAVTYMGKECPAGTVSGWEIRHVFAKGTQLPDVPFYDCTIGISSMESVDCIWKDGIFYDVG